MADEGVGQMSISEFDDDGDEDASAYCLQCCVRLCTLYHNVTCCILFMHNPVHTILYSSCILCTIAAYYRDVSEADIMFGKERACIAYYGASKGNTKAEY